MSWQYRNTVLVLCTLAFFATMVARLVISPVVPNITDSFGVSNSAVGLALTGMWMAYATAQFPSGVLGDRYGERTIILTAVGLTAVASGFLALSPTFAVFLAFTIFLGAVAGLHYSVATSLLTKKFENIGRAIGIHGAGGPIAGLAAPAAAAYVGAAYGWRFAIALGALAALPSFFLFSWRIRPTPPERPDVPVHERFELRGIVELLSRPAIAYTTALAVLCAFSWQATASFLPTFLVEYRGQSQTVAGLSFSGYFVVQGIASPLVGSLSDRYSRDGTVAMTMFVGIFGYGLLISGPGWTAVVLAIVLVGVAMSWGAALLPRFMDNLSDAERGAGFGLVRTVYMVIGSLGSVVVGILADLLGWATAFGVLAGMMALVFTALVANRTLRLGF